jgi:exopolysaccharide biosynthesis protein
MNHRIYLLIAFFSLGFHAVKAQNQADSIAIVSASWDTSVSSEGIVHRRASFPSLYEGPQYINLVEIPSNARLHYGISASDRMKQTSLIARENQASAAINGSFYNMQQGNSVCYFRIGKEVVDTTSTDEFRLRVTGAVHTHKRKVKILPWSPDIEKNYRGRKGTLLASGPLLMMDGKACSWESCDSSFIYTKHPRSAIFRTKDKRTILLTVDGRSPGHADGMSIPELAHLIRILNGYDALNLDGGGSTTLWMEEYGVLNSPSDNRKFDHEGERKVSNIIYVRKAAR